MPVQHLKVYSFENEQVLVCVVRANQCRVVRIDHQGSFFPESFLVPIEKLVEVSPQPQVNRERLQPCKDEIYSWEPPANSTEAEYTPSNEKHQMPPKLVRVKRKDWQTTGVGEVTATGVPKELDYFRVFNHHLRRD